MRKQLENTKNVLSKTIKYASAFKTTYFKRNKNPTEEVSIEEYWDTYHILRHTFGSDQFVKNWLSSPNIMFNGKTPIELPIKDVCRVLSKIV